MDLTVNSLPHATIRQDDLEQDLSVSYVPCQVESGGSFSLQVLEFKTCLLEAVEELQIRRDAEIRFGQQISKLVLEKQELEWQMESLQHQLETMLQQHTEALASVKKQFQEKMKAIEEEKGIHQLHAQAKENAINGLKEELKVLQLSSYSLEKKSSELEQKLALQSRSKDSYLSQRREVEKRFEGLSRLCATIKQTHGTLGSTVQEAMRMNSKLTSVNKKQESTIRSLMQELGETNSKLIRVQVGSMVVPESRTLSATDQHLDQLQQRLLLETEMNRKLMEENATERADKQELMRSLQVAQQLLLCQTSALPRLEMELQQNTEQYQTLKRDHETMRAQSAAAERRVASLTEEHATTEAFWEKERAALVESLEKDQHAHGVIRDEYSRLCQKHSGLSSQTVPLAQPTPELQIEEVGKVHNITTPLLCEDGSLHQPSRGSELPCPVSERGCVPSQTADPDSVVLVTEELAAIRAMRGEEGSRNHPSLQHSESRVPFGLVASTVATGNRAGQHTLHSPADSQTDSLSTEAPHPITDDWDPVLLADVIDNNACLSDVGLLKDHNSSVSGPENSSVYDDADLVIDLPSAPGQDGAKREPSEREASAVQAEGTKEQEEGLSNREEDGCSRPCICSPGPEEGGERLTEEAVDTRQGDTGLEDDGEETDKTTAGQGEERMDLGAEGSGSLACSPDTEIGCMTSGDNVQRDGERSHAQQGIHPLKSTEPPASASASHLPLEVTGICAHTGNLTTDRNAAVLVAPHAVQQHSCDCVESGSLCTSSICELSVNSREEIERPSHVPFKYGSRSTECCFSSTLPDNPLSQSQSEPRDTVQNNLSKGVDRTKTGTDKAGRCDEPEKEASLIVTAVEIQPLHQENSERDSTSKELSSSERRASQHPVHSAPMADVEDSCTCDDASPDDLIVDPLQAPPAPLCPDLPDEDTDNTNINVNMTAADVETQQQVTEAEAAQTKEFPPTDQMLKPANPPCHESPPKTDSRGHCSVEEDMLERFVPCNNKKYRSPFDLAGFQGGKGSARFPQCLSSTSVNVNQNKVPVAPVTAPGLPCAPDAAVSQKRDQEQWKAVRQAFRDTAADHNNPREDGRSPALHLQLPSPSAEMGSGYGPTRPTGPPPVPGSSSGSDWSGLRSQISRIEQFLSTGRLRLPKRSRPEN